MPQAVLDFSAYIAEHIRDFTGREWVFAEIDRWLADPGAPRYFIITGEPGIGKTAIAARLTQIRDLAAVHFCIAHQANTVDPLDFARSLSHQLMHLDCFAQCLLEDQGVRVDVSINVQENYGQIIGVQIENLTSGSRSAAIAFNRTVVDPLKRLYADGFDQQLVILVDALDETVQQPGPETIADLLANARGLPPQVRFVLTSRPEDAALRHFEQLHSPYLVLDAGREENLQDVQEYIRGQLAASEALRTRLAEQKMQHQAFIERVTEASQGNFLYLVWLLPAVADGTQRFDALGVLPKGLDGIHREFLRTRMVGKNIGQWRDHYRPLLGVLAAAQEALTAEQLTRFTGLSAQEVDDFLLDVQQFLDPIGARQGQYRLYHQSLVGFLSSKEQAGEFWIDLAQIHRRIADYYRGDVSAEEVTWDRVDDYGKRYLAAHLYALKDVETYRRNLCELVESQAWTAAKYVNTPWAGSLVQDLQLASASTVGGNVEDWARSMGCQLRRALVEYLMSTVSDRAILFLARLGQVEQALDLARRQWSRFKLLREIAQTVASTQPAKATDILVELAHVMDDGSALEQCKARLAAAQEIFRLVPSHSRVALNLIEEVKSLEQGIPDSDLIKYRVEWDLPTLALSDELGGALLASDSFSPLEKAQALRHISLALPQDHPLRQSLLRQTLSVLEALEQAPETASESIKVMVALLPLVDEDERKALLDSLASAGDYLQSVEAPDEYAVIPHWAIGRIAEVDLNWARRMLFESNWGSTPEAFYQVVQEIAKVDYAEALQLVRDRFSNHILSPKLLTDIIETVALKDIDKAEALIEEYADQLRDDKEDAYVAIAEAYLVRGDTQKAQEIFDELAIVSDGEGFVHAKGNLRLAILARSDFLPVEVARGRLMHFPTCPHCHKSREQEAEIVLARIAARQGRVDFLEQHNFGQEARLAAACNLADCAGPEVARGYLESQHLASSVKGAKEVCAHIAAVEAQQDPTKLDILLKHFDDNGRPHHFCDYMLELPHTLRKLVETKRIEPAEAMSIIDQLYPLLVDWQCPHRDQPPEHDSWRTRCACYGQSEHVLAQLIGITAWLAPDRSEEMVSSLPAQPIRVYALEQILCHTQANEDLVQRVIKTSQECIEDPWQRAESYYTVAALLPAEMSGMIKSLIELAEPLLDETPTDYHTNRYGIPIRIGPSSTSLKIYKARALMKLVRDVSQFAYVREGLRAIESLVQLDDKLRVFDFLGRQATKWSREDRLALLWHIWEVSTTRRLEDVEAFIAFLVPIVYSLGGEAAFWRLYDCVERAYQGLPRVD